MAFKKPLHIETFPKAPSKLLPGPPLALAAPAFGVGPGLLPLALALLPLALALTPAPAFGVGGGLLPLDGDAIDLGAGLGPPRPFFCSHCCNCGPASSPSTIGSRSSGHIFDGFWNCKLRPPWHHQASHQGQTARCQSPQQPKLLLRRCARSPGSTPGGPRAEKGCTRLHPPCPWQSSRPLLQSPSNSKLNQNRNPTRNGIKIKIAQETTANQNRNQNHTRNNARLV